MRKKLLVLLAIACCLVLVGCNGFNNSGEATQATNGIQAAENADSVLIGTIDGEDYFDIDPEIQAERYSLQGAEWTPEEMAAQMLEQEVLYRTALDNGVAVSDEEVEQYINTMKENMPLDEQGQALFLEMCKEYGWTEDEYWEKSFETYKRGMVIGKYRQILEDEITSDLKDANISNEKMENEIKQNYENELHKIYKEENVRLLYDKSNKVTNGKAMDRIK